MKVSFYTLKVKYGVLLMLDCKINIGELNIYCRKWIRKDRKNGCDGFLDCFSPYLLTM